MERPRLFVAAARLPVALTQRHDGWTVEPSPGGLVTALRLVADRRGFTWIGWPGAAVPDSERESVRAVLQEGGHVPVFIPPHHIDGFHRVYSSQTLWPLLHDRIDRVRLQVDGWRAYQAVNEQFADVIARSLQPGDIVWIHDYQLMLVPAMLRDRGIDNPIGFFLHVPFPAAETFRYLPQREQILQGILASDVVAFQSHEYASHFREASTRLVGARMHGAKLRFGARQVDVAALPIGIDAQEMRQMAESRDARQEQASLQTTYAGRHIVLGVDRFDYTKGLVEKLQAFELLLERYPRWRQRAVLVQVAAPSRMGVDEYQQLKREVDELVGRINGRYGTSSFTPVVYVHQSISRERLTGLFRAADIALVTPVRDGFNLVALEYIAARADRGGTLILSEFTGAANCLPGARLVNPYHAEQVAETLAECLEHPTAMTDSFRHMLRFVEENTATAWADAFIDRLERCVAARGPVIESLDLRGAGESERLRRARVPLVLLGDGAIMTQGVEARIDPRALDTLRRLGERALVYVLSGRSSTTLQEWFGDTRVGLVSEHGLSARAPGGTWETWERRDQSALRGLVDELLREFTWRTPNSAVEYRSAAVVWHYRSALPEFASLQARQLAAMLDERLRGKPYAVHRGRRSVEVRHESLTKGQAASRLMARHTECDWVFCAGDDLTEQSLIDAVLAHPGPHVQRVCCSVGGRIPGCRTWVPSTAALLAQLEHLEQTLASRSPQAGT